MPNNDSTSTQAFFAGLTAALAALFYGSAESETDSSRAANAEDFYRERARQLSSENTAIADTLVEAQSTGKRQRCEVTLTLLEEVHPRRRQDGG